MGTSAKRKAKFKAEHPTCYFCATNPTETEDHVPSRECFRGRLWPDGYAFPACQGCNHAGGKIEQVVALYLHMFNHDGVEPSHAQFSKLITGVANNTPELLPKVGLSANAVRRHFRDKGIQLAPGMAYGEVPMAELPAGNRTAFELFARRLTCALFYKEVGFPMPLDFAIAVGWLPYADPATADFMLSINGFFPELRMTNRSNVDIGDQFVYMWGAKPDGRIFGFTAQFAKSFFFFGAAAGPELDGGTEHWKPHANDVAEFAKSLGSWTAQRDKP